MSLRLRAPAKVNWSLEALGQRPDGYREVRTILQTIAFSDRVTLSPADDLELKLGGDVGALEGHLPDENLAYRAAASLYERTAAQQGVRIELEKRIPVAAGLGGGSSDAAAVLRGLRSLWDLSVSDEELASIAAALGSDLPFFLRGGGALASGRGEEITPLPDGPERGLVLGWPRPRPVTDKTARMYAALGQEHDSDGSRTERLAERLRAGGPVREEDLFNVFEAVLPEVDPEAAESFDQAGALGLGCPHLCGSGPAFYFLLAPQEQAEPLVRALQALGLEATVTATLAAAQAISEEG